MKKIATLFFIVAGLGLTINTKADVLNDRLKAIFGDKTIEVSDYNGLLKTVVVDSDQFLFASHDGRYLYAGSVFDTLRKVDIVAEREAQYRQSILGALPEDVFVRYPSVGIAKHQITVFTDIDCPFCRKLHNTMNDLNQRGISVNYVMLPRTGTNSASFAKTLSALCSEDPAKNITRAMQNKGIVASPCNSTQLSQHIALARKFRIVSTPTIVLPTGELRPGFLSADELVNVLKKES